ncbi:MULTISPECIES: hypothetical protein [Brucella/Ochrobactrum group]|uniref:Uncharacterized protein n=1 Tax=Brucella anthropi (strain ATCC 49188 / DSM 6882 / CCUG 24695 / JCM 21032 / LMG 3331 / NBRC 15819 / NCTC 12168 / Alc 37) TaxID=439375 RepID=A6WV38_BRUA4|nr:MULTISPECIES: hypothetical protein [Brucella/Ochrobactrum group]ABS12842.1 hypothetical protein Oant_0111 [Brucella anthropi ATCC 49188]AIK45399.1 hypothetical protein DR92_136 [Brucella anthropi]KAB2734884.1 hypothetical protein F9K90_12795 [Brucella anthropi]KAB2753012.1 hypothetical protein F9K95_10905 [Brucella anthropi]KAB2763659.1 hypothetical protein F9K98_07210 [Brucella anthropi]
MEPLEKLVGLYLRLNGYFLSKYIIHSPKSGTVRGEVDWLAFKGAHHSQSHVGDSGCDFLSLKEKHNDIIICEVKSSASSDFNKSLKSTENIKDILSWIGVVSDRDIDSLAEKVSKLVSRDVDKIEAQLGIVYQNYVFRPLLAIGVDSDRDFEKRWRLNTGIIFNFIKKRLATENHIPSCSRNYGASQWGDDYKDLIDWFKKNNAETINIENFNKKFKG